MVSVLVLRDPVALAFGRSFPSEERRSRGLACFLFLCVASLSCFVYYVFLVLLVRLARPLLSDTGLLLHLFVLMLVSPSLRLLVFRYERRLGLWQRYHHQRIRMAKPGYFAMLEPLGWPLVSVLLVGPQLIILMDL